MDLPIAARIAMLAAQAAKDLLGRVSLLGRGVFVIGQNLVDDGMQGS